MKKQVVYGILFGLALSICFGAVVYPPERGADFIRNLKVRNIVDTNGNDLATLKTVYDVRDYGAVGDGVTDDTAAFNAAKAAASSARFGTVYMPNGRYRITSPLTVLYGFEWNLQGEGAKAVIYPDLDAQTESALVIGATPTGVYNCTFKDFEICGGINKTVEECTTGWTAADANETVTHSSTFYNWSANSLKIVTTSEQKAGDMLAYKDISSLDISDCNVITFTIWCSNEQETGDFQVVVSESLHAAGEKTGTYTAVSNNPFDAKKWCATQSAITDLSAFNAVRSVSIWANATIPTGTTIYLDTVQAHQRTCYHGISVICGAFNRFENVGMACGSAEAAWSTEGSISNILEQCYAGGSQGGYTYSRPCIGFHFQKDNATSTQPNLNIMNGCSAQLGLIGTWVEDTHGMTIQGQYEFNLMADVVLEDSDFVRLHDSYSEGGSWRNYQNGCSNIQWDNYYFNGGGVDSNSASEDIGIRISNSWAWQINASPNSSGLTLGPDLWTGTFPDEDQIDGSVNGRGLVETGRSPVFYPPFYYSPTGVTETRADVLSVPYSPYEQINHLPNSSFSSWNSTRPTGWTFYGAAGLTATQTGDGLADPNRHFSPFACLLTNPATSGSIEVMRYDIDDTNDLKPLQGRYVTYSAWIMPEAGTPYGNTPCLWAQLTCPVSGNFSIVGSASIVDEDDLQVWRRHYTGFYVPDDCTKIRLWVRGYTNSGTVSFYFAEPALMVGFYGQSTWVDSKDEHTGDFTVNGRILADGTELDANDTAWSSAMNNDTHAASRNSVWDAFQSDFTFAQDINAVGATFSGVVTVNGDQTGATDHVFDDYNDLQLLQDWRAGKALPFKTGDLLNRDRLLRDTIVGLNERIKILEKQVAELHQ